MISNYHTHTKRCFHAVGNDEEYVKAAIKKGFKVLGFSDHGPWPYKDYISGMRMSIEESADYIRSINRLKEKYKDEIDIKLGFEYEYFPEYFPWLDKFIADNGVDYIILGHHFINNEINGAYTGTLRKKKDIFAYCNQICDAIKSKRYAYIAHPDLYMRGYSKFDKVAIEVAEKICDTANEYNIPLEYNILGLRKNDMEGKEGYPYRKFWEIVAQNDNKVILGVDAHSAQEITECKYINEAEETMKELGIQVCQYI